MLTFEYDADGEMLSIHGDAAGLQSLQRCIQRLLDQTPEGQFEHSHLMTRDWGGDGLTSQRKEATAALVHHVKVYCWKVDRPA